MTVIHRDCAIFWRAAILLLIAAGAASAAAQSTVDRIRRRTGVDTGEVTAVSVLSVTLIKNGVERKVPVEEIREIYFAGEPAELATARSALERGRPEDALTALDKIKSADVVRPELVAEIDFLRLQSQARKAQSGGGSLTATISSAQEFLTNHGKSYRVPSAIELLGDLYLANGQSDEARAQYAKLAKAPAPYFQARSALLLGQVLAQEGKHSEALAEFDRALAAAQGNAAAQPLELEATLHRAVSRSATGEVEAATADVKEIITQADAEDVELLATAYNALGDCYLQNDKPKAARDAFLHVDLLFSAAADQHAKALHELAKLWETLGQPQRARDARQRLQEDYPSSRWARD